jgi:uncharacterized protein YndB with AHSA1/START domain
MTQAKKTESTFAMECSVRCAIAAPPERVWALLTAADDFPKWNSTVTKIDGPIRLGQKLAIEVPAAKGRVFKPKVTAFEPEKTMVWSDGMAPMFKGVRTFTLAHVDGGTEFSMVEKLTGLMLPMIKGSLPDFVPIFERYAEDLKVAAEKAS